MKVLLINFSIKKDEPWLPIGIAYIAASLHVHGHSVSYFDMALYENGSSVLLEHVAKNNFDLIGLNGFIGKAYLDAYIDIVGRLKMRSPGSKIVLGGPMASAIPEILLRLSRADIVIIGEAEETILKVCECFRKFLSFDGLQGVGYRDGEDIKIDYDQSLLVDLDRYSISSVAHLFPVRSYRDHLYKANKCFSIIASRGCYSKCAFCWVTRGKQMNYRSVKSVIDEMDFFYDNYGIDRFNFVDDNFLNDTDRIMQFCESLLCKEKKYKWRFQARVERFNEDLVRIMVRSGLFGVSFGLESGSQKILDEMKKNFTVRDSENAIRIAKKYDLSITASFIIGMPSEDIDTFGETKKFISSHVGENFEYKVFYLSPAPCTPIYEYAKHKGVIKDEVEYIRNMGDVFSDTFVNLTSLTDETLRDMKHDLTDLGVRRI